MPRLDAPTLADIAVDELSPAARYVFDEILYQHVVEEVPLAELAGRLGLTSSEIRNAIEFFGCEIEASLGGARLPALDAAAYEALRDDIAERGQIVPIIVTPDGEIVEGHNRMRACRELGIPPVTIPRVTDDLHGDGLAANLNRRHLNHAQKRRVISIELLRDPEQSDRAVGRLVGVHHSTVSAVRRDLARLRARLEDPSGEISHPPTPGPARVKVDEELHLALEQVAREAARYYDGGAGGKDAALETALERWRAAAGEVED